MSRKSAEAMALTVVAGNFGARAEPPKDLTEAQAAIWREISASESADFFRTAALRRLLKDYCRHTAFADDLACQIGKYALDEAMTPDVVQTLDRLTKMHDRETKAAGDKATKLRLTNQSRYTPQAAATAAKNASVQVKPWERNTQAG